MNLGKIQKQLGRDIKKSPKKAAILALLALVAIYTWAPLLIGSSSDEAAKPVAASAENVPSGQPAAIPPTAALISWIEADKLISQDARMRSAEFAATVEPFGNAMSKKIEDDEESAPADKKEEEELAPDRLGLLVTGTIIGGGRRVATINGKPVSEGRQVEAGGKVFSLALVQRKQVVLVHGNKEYLVPVSSSAPLP